MLRLILLIIIAMGVTIIYDARSITDKYFSSNFTNQQIKWLKIVSFIITIIAGIIFCFI